jgi:hypothetical protein
MAILAPENSEINVSRGHRRGWGQIGHPFPLGRYLIIDEVPRLVIYRWRLTGGPGGSRRPAASIVIGRRC